MWYHHVIIIIIIIIIIIMRRHICSCIGPSLSVQCGNVSSLTHSQQASQQGSNHRSY
jgi:hypothetical protein